MDVGGFLKLAWALDQKQAFSVTLSDTISLWEEYQSEQKAGKLDVLALLQDKQAKPLLLALSREAALLAGVVEDPAYEPMLEQLAKSSVG